MSNNNPLNANVRLALVRTVAAQLGVDLETNRPGDRTRRFLFTMPWGATFVCSGIHEAEIFIAGLGYGREFLARSRMETPT